MDTLRFIYPASGLFPFQLCLAYFLKKIHHIPQITPQKAIKFFSEVMKLMINCWKVSNTKSMGIRGSVTEPHTKIKRPCKKHNDEKKNLSHHIESDGILFQKL